MAKKAKKDEASAKSKSKAKPKQKAKDDKDKKAKKKPAAPRAKKRKAAKATTAESPLTTMAVTLGAALGRTERVARTARDRALEAKKTLQQKFAALAKKWKRARSKTHRTASRKKQG